MVTNQRSALYNDRGMMIKYWIIGISSDWGFGNEIQIVDAELNEFRPGCEIRSQNWKVRMFEIPCLIAPLPNPLDLGYFIKIYMALSLCPNLHD